MATPKQRAANRRNARKSTGPRSRQGKAATRWNALKHGLRSRSQTIPTEDEADYLALYDSLRRSVQPVDDLEDDLVTCMAEAEWRRLRYNCVEADLVLRTNGGDPVLPVSLVRHETRARRDFLLALEVLQRRRALAAGHPPAS